MIGVGLVMNDGARLHAVTGARKWRQRRLHHQWLVDAKGGFCRPIGILRMHNGHDTVSGEAVRGLEARLYPALFIGMQRSIPIGARQEILPELRLDSVTATAPDKVSLVAKGGMGKILRKHLGEGGVGVHVVRQLLMKK